MDSAKKMTAAKAVLKAAGDVSRRLYELGKSLKDGEVKQQIDEILDQVRELKQSASEVEDENCELRDKLRFKSDAYEFRTPFWYEKIHPDQPLCPKCFASNVAAPMGAPGQHCAENYRRCLVCHQAIEISRAPRVHYPERHGDWS